MQVFGVSTILRMKFSDSVVRLGHLSISNMHLQISYTLCWDLRWWTSKLRDFCDRRLKGMPVCYLVDLLFRKSFCFLCWGSLRGIGILGVWLLVSSFEVGHSFIVKTKLTSAHGILPLETMRTHFSVCRPDVESNLQVRQAGNLITGTIHIASTKRWRTASNSRQTPTTAIPTPGPESHKSQRPRLLQARPWAVPCDTQSHPNLHSALFRACPFPPAENEKHGLSTRYQPRQNTSNFLFRIVSHLLLWISYWEWCSGGNYRLVYLEWREYIL